MTKPDSEVAREMAEKHQREAYDRYGDLDFFPRSEGFQAGWSACLEHSPKVKALLEALQKIEDPRKRDHKEPDAYTQLGCVMNIASEALALFEKEG